MYYGKMTNELKQLYEEYEKVWGYTPDGCEDLEYGDEDYDDYVSDIKKSLKLNLELPNIFPDDEY